MEIIVSYITSTHQSCRSLCELFYAEELYFWKKDLKKKLTIQSAYTCIWSFVCMQIVRSFIYHASLIYITRLLLPVLLCWTHPSATSHWSCVHSQVFRQKLPKWGNGHGFSQLTPIYPLEHSTIQKNMYLFAIWFISLTVFVQVVGPNILQWR